MNHRLGALAVIADRTGFTSRSVINRVTDRAARRFAPDRAGTAKAGATFVGARPHEQRERMPLRAAYRVIRPIVSTSSSTL